MRFKHARHTPFTSVLLPLLFNRLFGLPFQAEYAIKSAVRKNLFWLRGCKWLCYNRESDEILIYIIAARIVIRYQYITAWKAVLVTYALFYSEKGLVKMRLIAKIYEIYDKYNMRQ